ncbi:hypothetical protein TELCIR_02285 [Teladorsagia circumcincta]|uniref:M protein repeat protein n=1 Tax=Teladorsagia circumcincta TaxID=45464 RepID=A0A2G9V1N0_TELCI|nr:hypothetical protein TELCIR_02285 [Teladorsagia circumcincta]
MRQVHDKSYYMGLLRSKINQISLEIARLEEVYQKGERDRMELDAYEQRAKESAMEVKELQRKLLNYNLLVDRMHSNHEVGDLEAEARRAKEGADEDPSLRETFEELKAESETLAAQVEEAQEELARLEEKKEQLELELMNSPVKKKAMELKQLLIELEAKEAALVAEKEAMETPEQKKQKLIDEIKKNNEDITTIEKQIEKTNELINTAHEEIREFDSSADNKLAKNNEKYRDLMVKEREYDEFLSVFEEQKQVHETELNVTAMDTDGLLHGKTSAKELQDLYVRLKEQIIAMDEQEARLNAELQSFDKKMQEMEEQRNVYSDLDQLAADVENNIRELEGNREELERILPGLEQRRDALEEQLREVNEQLESNPEFAEVSEVKLVESIPEMDY